MGLQLLGLPGGREGDEEVSWWEDRFETERPEPVLRLEQPEFWAPPAEPETTRAPEAALESRPHELENESEANVFTIAKFLRISRALYDGRDKSRWLLLPRRRSAARYPLMAGPGPCPGTVRELRLSPRGLSGTAR